MCLTSGYAFPKGHLDVISCSPTKHGRQGSSRGSAPRAHAPHFFILFHLSSSIVHDAAIQKQLTQS